MTTNLQHLSLAQLFGEGAFQDANILVIQKASLLKLTPKVANKAESLFAAILLNALNNFEGIIVNELEQPIVDELGQPIAFDNSEAYELLKMIRWKPFQSITSNQPYIINQIIAFSYAQQ